MTTLCLRVSLQCLALICLASISSQCQAQVLPASGNTQVTADNAEVLFGTGAREIVVGGLLDIDMATFGAGSTVNSPFGATTVSFDASDVNTSTVSVDLQNESGLVIGTFTSNNLRLLALRSSPNGNPYSASFIFDDPLFTSNDAGTSGIVGTSLTITVTDNEFTGTANATTGLSPDEFLTNVSNGSFIIDQADVEILFRSGDSLFVERIGILQSDPNQQFALETTTTLLGDANLDGMVNFLDISPFIAILSAGPFLEEADVNEDDIVDFLDISPFIGLLSGS